MFFRNTPKYYASPVDQAMAERRHKLRSLGFIALLPITPLLLLVSLPYSLLRMYHKSESYAKKLRRAQEKLDLIPPALTKRKRSLSTCATNARRTKSQDASLLFKLPAELRAQVYEYVIGKREGIHVVARNGRLDAYRCQWSAELELPARHDQCWNYFCNGSWAGISGVVWNERTLEVMGLLRSCRAV
jgi:hypothetical protein